MYTLGGGVDPAARAGATATKPGTPKRNSPRYGVQPDWFGLGDRDLATHLVRTQMLQRRLPAVAGHRGVVRPVATGRAVAARQRRPVRDPRGDHRSGRRQPAGDPLPGVVGALPRPGAHAQLRVCRRRKGQRRTRSRRRRSPTPTSSCWRRPTRWSASAPSWRCPASAAALRVDHRPGRRLLPDHRRKAVARHGRRVPVRDRRGVHRRGGGPALRRPQRHRHTRRLAGRTRATRADDRRRRGASRSRC